MIRSSVDIGLLGRHGCSYKVHVAIRLGNDRGKRERSQALSLSYPVEHCTEARLLAVVRILEVNGELTGGDPDHMPH